MLKTQNKLPEIVNEVKRIVIVAFASCSSLNVVYYYYCVVDVIPRLLQHVL
jgi:hypothetical protein